MIGTLREFFREYAIREMVLLINSVNRGRAPESASQSKTVATFAVVVGPRYYFSTNYDQNVWSCKTSHRADVFFSRRIHSCKINFSWFLRRIFTVSIRRKSGKYVHLAWQSVFFSHHTDSFPGATQGCQGRPGECMLRRHVVPSMNNWDML